MEGDGVVEGDVGVQGRSKMAEPPPEMRKKTSVSLRARLSMTRAARAAAKDSSLGTGWPPSK
jgi:hypothetical protein